MREIIIAPKTEGKGRSFQAVLLATVEADLLWTKGRTKSDNARPVWAMFGGADSELRAFMANLVSGHKAIFPKRNYGWHKEDGLEILKSVDYQVIWQREEEGSLVTIYLPELFQIDPGMVDPSGIQFILLPTQEWYNAQKIDSSLLVAHIIKCGYHLEEDQIIKWLPLAYLFAAYLDRRTRCPLIADGRFYIQLMLACLNHKLASFSTAQRSYYNDDQFGIHHSSQYHENDIEEVGLFPGLAFNSDHTTFEALLSNQVSFYFELIKGHKWHV